MPRVKIVTAEPTYPYGQVASGHNTKVFLDGTEVKDVVRVDISPITLDDPITVTIQVLVSPGSEFDLGVDEVKG